MICKIKERKAVTTCFDITGECLFKTARSCQFPVKFARIRVSYQFILTKIASLSPQEKQR